MVHFGNILIKYTQKTSRFRSEMVEVEQKYHVVWIPLGLGGGRIWVLVDRQAGPCMVFLARPAGPCMVHGMLCGVNDVTILHPEPNPNPKVQPHQSNNPTIQVVHTQHHLCQPQNPHAPHALRQMPCTTHAPMPCTAQLACQPKPKSNPT